MSISERIQQGVSFDTSDLLEQAGGVRHAFSTRLGGVSGGIWSSMNLGTTRGDDPEAVRENYRRFCAAVGVNGQKIVMSNQVHGAEVRAVTLSDVKRDLYDPEGYETDGLMTDIPGITLVVFAADCIPAASRTVSALPAAASRTAAAQDGFAGPCGRFDGHGDLLLFVHAQHGVPVFRLARRDLRPFKPRRRTHERHGKSRSCGLYHRHNCRYLHHVCFPAFQHGQRRQHQPARAVLQSVHAGIPDDTG